MASVSTGQELHLFVDSCIRYHVDIKCLVFHLHEANEMAHGYGSNTLSNKAYGEIMVKERPKQDNIDDLAYNKYTGDEVIMDVLGEDPSRGTVRSCVEDSDGAKVGTYYWNPLMDTREYNLEYDYRTHDL